MTLTIQSTWRFAAFKFPFLRAIAEEIQLIRECWAWAISDPGMTGQLTKIALSIAFLLTVA